MEKTVAMETVKEGLQEIRSAESAIRFFMKKGQQEFGKILAEFNQTVTGGVKRKATQIGPNPGVTKHQNWVKLDNNIELLDTPGILWPRIENHEVGLRLTITGAIKDSIVGTSKLSIYLLSILKNAEPKKLEQFYKLELSDIELPPANLINKIAEKRGCLKMGGIIDRTRAESLFLRDFRAGKLGKLSFDIPTKI